MMIVSSPQPPDIKQQQRQQRLETAIWTILCVQVLEVLVLIMMLVRR
jgi:hypothetical protein